MSNKYDDIMQKLGAVFLLKMAKRRRRGGSRSCEHQRSAPICGEAGLSEIESLIGARLPEDYRHFLQVYGDATRFDKKWECMVYEKDRDEGIELDVSFFYGIRSESCYPVRKEYESRAEIQYMPKRLFPIANGDGCIFCMSISGEDRGVIYGWHPEDMELVVTENDYVVLDERTCVVAQSFDEFMHGIRCIPEK